MRSWLGGSLIAAALATLVSLTASADEGAWRVTSPRVALASRPDRLELVIPSGRARGVTSRAISIEPGQEYVAVARLDLDALIARGAFLRVALYPSAAGGRQRLRLDSTFAADGESTLSVRFAAPSWARAAKLRVLARPDAERDVETTIPALLPVSGAPVVVLRPEDE